MAGKERQSVPGPKPDFVIRNKVSKLIKQWYQFKKVKAKSLPKSAKNVVKVKKEI